MSLSLVLRKLEICDSIDVSLLYGDNFGRPWSTQEIQSLLSQAHVTGYAYLCDEKMHAFILASVVGKEAEVYSVFVNKEYRRQGLAAALLKAIYQAHPGLENIFLEVAQSNHTAQKFYEKMGFEAQGVRKEYYKKTNSCYEDAVIMSKNMCSK